MGFDVFTARCGCGAIIRLPNLKARASAARCDACARGDTFNRLVQQDWFRGLEHQEHRAPPPLRDQLIDCKPLPGRAVGGKLHDQPAAHALFTFLAELCLFGRMVRSDACWDDWQLRKAINRMRRAARLQVISTFRVPPKHWSDCYRLSGAELRKAWRVLA